jgi:Domain of unknown function (DUF4149)
MATLRHWQAWLSSLWLGLLLTLGGVAAPALFAVLDRVSAGQAAGRFFSLEAYLSLIFAAALLLLERRLLRSDTSLFKRNRWSLRMWLIVIAVLLTLASQYLVHPMLQSVKDGHPGALSFGALHAISSTLFAVKTAVVLVLSWRCVFSNAR